MRESIENSWLWVSMWLVCAVVLAIVFVGGGTAYLLCRLGIRPQVEKWTKGKMRGAKLRECC